MSIALGDAIQDLDNAGIPLDASPGQEQYVPTSEPLPFDNAPPTGPVSGPLTGQGYAPVYFGSSFVQAVTWDNGPCPVGATILTYSESDSTASPHHSDQTQLFSNHQWVTDRFCPGAVLADTRTTTVLPDDVTARRSTGHACARATESVSGTRLGPLMLGLTRRRARSPLPRFTTTRNRHTDVFCLAGGAIRAGYGRRAQLRALPGRPVGLTNRIVWLATANRHYRLRGLTAGARSARARRLRPRGPIRLGNIRWYLVADGRATGLLGVVGGRIAQIGIAPRSLSRTIASVRILLR